MDNDNQAVYMENVTYVTNLVRTTFGDTLKAFYEGDPIDIPRANLPCFIIEKSGTAYNTQDAPTGHDAVTETLSLRVVFDKADDLNLDDNVDLTERKLRKMVEGRDPATGQLSSDSLMYALRTDITLGQVIRNQDVQVTYGILPRNAELLTSEAQIIITISEIIRVVR